MTRNFLWRIVMICSPSTQVTAPGIALFRRSKIVHWLLVASLTLSLTYPAFAETDDSKVRVENAQTVATQNQTPATDSGDENPKNTRAAIAFIENQEAILEQVFSLAERLEEKTRIKRAELGDAEYEDLVEKGKNKEQLGVQVPGMGKAEATVVKPTPKDKGVIITRVVHEATGISFIIIDSRISLDSPHLQQLIARQHLDANNFEGRPVLVVQVESQTLATPNAPGIREQAAQYDLNYLPKPTTLSAKWKDWRNATWVTPTKWDFALSQFCALGQIGITCGMGELQKVLDPGHAHSYFHAAALSYIFATAVGTLSSPWRNWTNRGKPGIQTLKSSTLSAAFAYGLHLWDHGMTGMHSLFLMDPNGFLTKASVLAGLAVQFNIVSNVIINNITKNYWSEFSRIRENTGINRDYMTLRVPFTSWAWKTGIKRTSFESQMINFGPYTLKLAALTGFYLSLPMLGHIDAGKLAFWSSMVWVQYAAVKYAQHLNYEKFPMLRERWEKFPAVRFANFFVSGARRAALAAYSTVKEGYFYCEALLTQKNAPLRKPEDPPNGSSSK